MKHVLSLAFILISTLFVKANYTTMTFKSIGGENHVIGISGLEITFSEDELVASNPILSLSIPLSQIESMEFSTDDSTGSVNSISKDMADGPTSVYTTDGKNIGNFRSLSEALDNIPDGIYIMKYTDGTTMKIAKQ